MLKKVDRYLLGVLALAIFAHYVNLLPYNIDSSLIIFVSVAATIPVIISAFASLKSRKISVDLLASIALVASLLTREWASAAFINLMLTSARLFGYYTENKSRAAIKSLLKLRPEKARVKRDGKVSEIPVELVRVGDFVIIESGDRVAVDGNVVEGEASVDQSSLTGESIPVNKAKGDEVYSSTLAVSGSLTIVATKVGKDTTLEKIVGLVEGSQKEKASIRTTAEKFASWYIGATLIGSISVYIVFHDLRLLLALLLVACADDIAIAVPLAFLAAIGYAARRGVIIKGGAYLEALTQVNTFILDKTGTITKGKLAVHDVATFNNFSREEVLEFAGVSESVSDHPVARSIVRYAKDAKISFKEPSQFKEFPGKGIVAECRGKTIVAGKVIFAEENHIHIKPAEKEIIEKTQNEGYTITLIGYDAQLAGFISSADEVRPNAKSAIQKLKKLGVENVVMLTGDNERVAKKIAAEVGTTQYHASLLPEDKLKYVKHYLGPDKTVAMVGDGVNDAASLALADIGIAMGAIGSDAAIEASDIALMKDNLSELPETMELGRYANKIAKQDFWIWSITNAFGIFLVATRVIGPEGAAAFNFVTDFFPLINSLRLFNLHRKLK